MVENENDQEVREVEVVGKPGILLAVLGIIIRADQQQRAHIPLERIVLPLIGDGGPVSPGCILRAYQAGILIRCAFLKEKYAEHNGGHAEQF